MQGCLCWTWWAKVVTKLTWVAWWAQEGIAMKHNGSAGSWIDTSMRSGWSSSWHRRRWWKGQPRRSQNGAVQTTWAWIVNETSPIHITKSSVQPNVQDVLPFAPSMCRVCWVLIWAPTSCVKSLQMTTIWEPWSSTLASILWLLSRMTISHSGSENSGLHLVADLGTENGSKMSSLACSNDAVLTQRGLRRSTSSLWTGRLEAKMWAGVTWSSLPLRIQPNSSMVRAWPSALAWYRYCEVWPVEVEGTGGMGSGVCGG